MKLDKIAIIRGEGEAAFLAGLSIANNPHKTKEAFQKAAAWEHGWLSAFYKKNAPEFIAMRERLGDNAG